MHTPDIQVFYTELKGAFTKACFDFYNDQLPPEEQLRIRNYKRSEDRLSTLAGKALLIAGLGQMGITADWSRLKRNAYGKPYLESCEGLVDFNISHSGSYSVAAISTIAVVGIDIEAIRPLDVNDFESCFTAKEWRTIQHSNDILEQFFTCWSIKEAVIKAAGRGLSIPLSDVQIVGQLASAGAESYAYQKIALHSGYSFVIAAPHLTPDAIVPIDQTHLFDWT